MRTKKYLILGLVLVFIFSIQLTGLAAENDNLPNIRILATDGTIGGTGNGMIARNGEADDDELDFVASDTKSSKSACSFNAGFNAD